MFELFNMVFPGKFDWNHQAVYEDLDGTMTGYAGGSALAHNPTLDPSLCSIDQRFTVGSIAGAVCKDGISFTRIAWNNVKPSSINSKDATFTNRFGNTSSEWRKKSTSHAKGWSAVVAKNETTIIGFKMADHLTNISYSMKVYELKKDEYLYLSHVFKQEPDFFTTTGAIRNGTVGVPDPKKESHGAWNFNKATKQLVMLAKGNDNSKPTSPSAVPINLRVYRCFFLKCVVPTPPPAPQGRPEKAKYWSKVGDWAGTQAGYGGYNKVLPKDGDKVMINSDWWMVVDTPTPKLDRLYIYGALELENGRNHNLSANIIFISGLYGSLIVGWPDKPMLNSVIINLLGDHSTKDLPLNKGPNVGAKALGVFGRLQMFGKPRSVYWTTLAATLEVGGNSIVVEKPTDWQVGEEIMISTTTYESRQVEKFIIDAIGSNGTAITLRGTAKYKHLGGRYTVGKHVLRMAAKVGLLTRTIKIKGADDPSGAIGSQSFGGRVLVGKYEDGGVTYKGKAMFSNVEFDQCGQYGWDEDYDPR